MIIKIIFIESQNNGLSSTKNIKFQDMALAGPLASITVASMMKLKTT